MTGPEPPRGLLLTSRLVTARAALQSLHAGGIGAHVTRTAAARRHRYLVTCDGPVAPSSDRSCCSRARLRGAFLAAGTVVRPGGGAHLEIPVRDSPAAATLLADFARLGVTGVAVERRRRPVVTLRSAPSVGDGLTVMGAQAARLVFENARVLGEMRSEVNRRINAETANLRRGVSASVRQLAAISVLRGAGRWDRVPRALREAADLREAHPDETLEALADRAGCSRPAMGGRLQRLVALAGTVVPDGPG